MSGAWSGSRFGYQPRCSRQGSCWWIRRVSGRSICTTPRLDRASLLEADGAIVVLSADEPLSDEERGALETLSQRRARTFGVVYKADHLDAAELGEVRMLDPRQGDRRVG